ncbi:hypothetical protein PRIPAC_71976 [Pristionchus pacificus]|uniref:F-box domain-containing protein n=1 Tax=Pristionchus pacificus TaxID=54126 RepID=A0A2A6BZS1_PRIPA|nr:hypothetical protein PRIPAC_71976 [Pristionchus pacificus]|eukprot:PDM71502.1 hypothetical protein PRIPAC_37909 [Pristionchus pacificus]
MRFTDICPYDSLTPLEKMPYVALVEVTKNLDGLSFDFLSITSTTMKRRLSELDNKPIKEIRRLELKKTTIRKCFRTVPACYIYAQCGWKTLESTHQLTPRPIDFDNISFNDILRSVVVNAVCVNHTFIPCGKTFQWRDEVINIDRKTLCVTSKTLRKRIGDLNTKGPLREIRRLEISRTVARFNATRTQPVCRIFIHYPKRAVKLYITDHVIIEMHIKRGQPKRRSLLCGFKNSPKQEPKVPYTIHTIPASIVVFDDLLRKVTDNSVCINHSFYQSGKQIMPVVDAIANIPRRIRGIFRRRQIREDYFTRLPDTCLLEIFKHLTRKDLDYLKGVNKKIHSVSNDKSLDKIKWEQGGLYICQRKRLQLRSSNSKRCKEEKIYIVPLPFEPKFLTRLHSILRGHNVKSLTCWSMKCDMNMDPIRQEERSSSFTQLIKGIPIVEMKAVGNIIPSLITEQFLATVCASGMIAFISELFPVDYYQHKFQVSESFLPYLLKFHSLKAPGMILHTNWIVNLIMDYLNEEEEFGKREEIFNKMSDPCRVDFVGWEFAVDRPITSQLIKQQIRAAEFQYTLLPTLNDEKHSIVNIRNNMRAIISPFAWEVEDGAATFHVVEIEFCHELESS